MKAALLYLSLCSLVWAESELQPHYRKTKQKCVGEHQVMVKGHHSKHGFYIFNYVYSSSVPNNQSQIEKEDNQNNISSATDGVDSKPQKLIDKPTDRSQETREGYKVDEGNEETREGHKVDKGNEETRKGHKVDKGNEGKDRTTSESHQRLNEHQGHLRNWDHHHYHLKVNTDKERNEIVIEEATSDIDGSGDESFPGQVEIHHGLIVGKGSHEQGKDQEIVKGTNHDKPGRKDKYGKTGISSDTKPTKHGYIKNGVKENDSNSDHYLPKKINVTQSKDYSEVSLKGKTTPTKKESGRKEESSHRDLLGKDGHVTENSHLNGQGSLLRDIQRKAEHRREGNYTSKSGTGEIKTVNGKRMHNTTKHEKVKHETAMIVRKPNGEKDRSGVTKSPKKEEVKGDIISSRVEVTGKIKLHKKDEVREDVLKEKSKAHMKAVDISKTPGKDDSDVGATGKLISELADPVFTKPDKANHGGVILDGFGIAQSPPRGDVAFHGRIPGTQIPSSDATQEGTKGVHRDHSTHRESSIDKENLGLPKPHQKAVGSHEKIKRKGHESSLGDRETREKDKTGFDVKLDVSKDNKKRNTSYNKTPGDAADLEKSHIIYFSDSKVEHQGQKSVQFKSAPSLSHGSRNNIQNVFNTPKHGNFKSQEHSSTSTKRVKKITIPSKETSQASTRTHGSKTTKPYHGYSRTFWRKSSQHGKIHPSVKRYHKSDSSQSSESEENSRQDSRRVYKDYQNDEVDSYQSAESTEKGLSFESNESDNRSQMEDRNSNSLEYSQEHKSGA